MIQKPDKNYTNNIKVDIHDQNAYCYHVKKELYGKSWYYDIERLHEARKNLKWRY